MRRTTSLPSQPDPLAVVFFLLFQLPTPTSLVYLATLTLVWVLLFRAPNDSFSVCERYESAKLKKKKLNLF